MLSIWIWHIVAGIAAVIVSLSAFYQSLEKRWSVYQKLSEHDVEHVMNDEGEILSIDTCRSFLSFYNQLVFMGKSDQKVENYDCGTQIYLNSGEKLEIVKCDKFYEVRKSKKNGKRQYFRLYAKQH